MEERIEKTIKNLEKNNISTYFVENKYEAVNKVRDIIKEGEKIAVGGSMTLFETGVIDLLKNGKYDYLDRYKDGLTAEDIKEVYRKSFFADSYLVSTNAITEYGELYNVDGTGNRAAAMIYGPDKVIVVVGVNKIVKDLNEAIERNKKISAPLNAKRLQRKTPCAKVGYCMDCSSEERICNEYVLIKRQRDKGRIHVIIVNEELGY